MERMSTTKTETLRIALGRTLELHLRSTTEAATSNLAVAGVLLGIGLVAVCPSLPLAAAFYVH